MDILGTKEMLDFALSSIPKGDKKCTLNLSYLKDAHFSQKRKHDFRAVQRTKPFVNTLYAE